MWNTKYEWRIWFLQKELLGNFNYGLKLSAWWEVGRVSETLNKTREKFYKKRQVSKDKNEKNDRKMEIHLDLPRSVSFIKTVLIDKTNNLSICLYFLLLSD